MKPLTNCCKKERCIAFTAARRTVEDGQAGGRRGELHAVGGEGIATEDLLALAGGDRLRHYFHGLVGQQAELQMAFHIQGCAAEHVGDDADIFVVGIGFFCQ